MVTFAFEMFTEQLAGVGEVDGGEVREGVSGLEMIFEEGAEVALVAAEPLGEWDGKTHFGSVDDGVGEILSSDVFEDAFALAVG